MIDYKNILWTFGILLIAGLLIWLIFIISDLNLFQDNSVDTNIENILNGESEQSLTTCTLDFTKNLVCQGEDFGATLNDGANSDCFIYANDGSGWKNVYAGTTGSTGVWSETKSVDVLGTFTFRGLCDKDDNGNISIGDCVTNAEQLKVIDCTTPPVYENGDIVGGTDGSTIIGGGTDAFEVEIDLGDLPPTGEGDCKLQALINTNWNYINADDCFGVQAFEGMHFEFHDSIIKVWERTDTSPIALGSPTKCGLVWDGNTPFKFIAEKTLNLPNCGIDLEYDVSIVTCECGE